MAIEKRTGKDGKPAYRVRIASINPMTGKRRNLTIGTYRTKREAEKVEREALTNQDRGTLADPSKITMSELLSDWLATKRGAISDNAHAEYGIAVRKHIVPAMGQARVQRLTPAAVQRQYNAWRDAYDESQAEIAAWQARPAEERGPKPERHGISPRYMKRIHLVLAQALDYAIHVRLISTNPTTGTKSPTPKRQPPVIWSADELRRFLAVAVNDSRSPLWHLLGLEAMRRGEALGLRWSDVNWERGTIHLSQTVVPDQTKAGAAKIQPRTKTASGARTVRLTPTTLALLAEHRDRQRFIRQAAGDRWQDHDLIVATNVGTPVNPGNVMKALHRLADVAGVPRIVVHALRHTAASLLLASGTMSIKQISERLGHSSVAMTLDVYSHLLPDMQDAAALAMERIVAGTVDATGTE